MTDKPRFVIYKQVAEYPTREQAIAELFSLGAIVQGSDDFVGDGQGFRATIANGYKIVKEPTP